MNHLYGYTYYICVYISHCFDCHRNSKKRNDILPHGTRSETAEIKWFPDKSFLKIFGGKQLNLGRRRSITSLLSEH